MQPISEEGSSPQPASPQPRSYQPIKLSASGVRDESAQSIIVMEEFDDDEDDDHQETSPQQHRGWSRSEDPQINDYHHTGVNDDAGSPLAPSYASSSLPGSHNMANNGKHPTDRKKGAMEFIRALHAQQQQQPATSSAITTSSNPPKSQQQPVVVDHAADQTHISVSTVNDAGGGASASDIDINEDHHHHEHNNNAADRRRTNNVAAVQSSAVTGSHHHNPQQQKPQLTSSYKQGTTTANDHSNVLDTSEADSDRQAFKDMVKSLAASPDQSAVQQEGEGGNQKDQSPTKNSEILKMFLNNVQSTSEGQRTTTTTKQQQPRTNTTAHHHQRSTINNLTANNVYDSDSDSDGGGGDVVFKGEKHNNNNTSRATGVSGGDDNTTMNFVEESHHFVGVAKSNVEPAYEPSHIHMAPPPPQQGGGKGGLNSSRPASRAASSSNLLRRGSTETNPHAAAVLERMKQKDLELQIKKENRARAAQEEADRECTFQPATRASGSNTHQPAHSSDNFEANGPPRYDKETEAFASHRTAAIAHRRQLAERRQQQRFEEEKAMDLQLRNNTPKREALHHQDPNVTNNNNNAGYPSYSHQMAASKIHHTSSGRSLSPRSNGSSRPHSPNNNNNQQQQIVVGSPTSAISGRTYVFGTPQNRRGNQSGVPRSETSTVDMINMTFQPSIGSRSRNVYVNGARGVEGTLDTFTRLYSRSMSYQLSNPTYRDTLKREEEARAAYRRVNLNETNAITVLEEGSPERRFLSRHLLDVLPVPLSLELDGLRTHFHLMRDKDISGTSCTSTRQRTSTTMTGVEKPQVLPPHFMVPFLCNSLGCDTVSGIELVDTHGLGLNPTKGGTTTSLATSNNNTQLRNRYSRKHKTSGGEDGEEDAVGTILGTLCDANSYIPVPSPAPQGGPSTSTPRRSQSAGGGGRQIPAVRTEASLSEFLQRQKSLIESKRRKTEELAKKLAPSGKPTLSKGTISISDRQQRSASARAAATPARAASSSTTAATPKGRQQRELSPRQKREAELSKPRPTPTKHYDTNLTFKPVISPFATVSIEGRTTDRMFEEGQRRTDRLEKLREASWKREQSQGTTFKPKTNVGDATSRYGNVQSLLHPSNVKNNMYSSYLSKRKLVREKLHEVQTVEAEEEDLRECTFRPAINPQPSYITKMAQNYSLLKKY